MAQKYADRMFISINGARIADVQSGSAKRNFNRRPVHSMTENGRNRGYVEGNLDIDVDLTIAVQNKLARPKFEAIDYENNDVQLTAVCGADQYIVTGLVLKTNDDNAAGVGDEAKANFSFFGLDIKDAVGNSALFDLFK